MTSVCLSDAFRFPRRGWENITLSVSWLILVQETLIGYITTVVVMETFTALRGEKGQKLDKIRRCSSTWPFPRSPW